MKVSAYKINLETATHEATQAIYHLDASFVGTEHYLGVASFWCHEYRYPMRDASVATCKAVHAKMLKAGLEVDGFTPAHDEIIEWASKRTYKNVQWTASKDIK